MKDEDRVISLGQGLAQLPEELLLAHARGEVLFICGAGISRPQPADLPSFRELVLDVYARLDTKAYGVLTSLPQTACNQWPADCADLDPKQTAEVKRFILGDYDVVLGMLERRLDDKTYKNSSVRETVMRCIRNGRQNSLKPRPAAIHRAIVRLSDRGGATAIVTTNFDLLLEDAARRIGNSLQSYSLNSMPRPTTRPDFSGVFHIHGAVSAEEARISDFILTDQDFGDAYLRQRNVPDFIYDLSRLYSLVLVGYSASDPPMRYLLSAIAGDEDRFPDIKKRYVFVPVQAPNPALVEDWKGRGIVPIQYDEGNSHDALRATLERWAELSTHNGKQDHVERELSRIVKKPRKFAEKSDQDLFDHLFRRSPGERRRFAIHVSELKADVSWLTAIASVCCEPKREQKR
jgi:hypothetical protein